MIPINNQVSRSKVKVKGQAYYTYVGEGGISVLQTSIFNKLILTQGYVFHADKVTEWCAA